MYASRIPCHFRIAAQPFKAVSRSSLASRPTSIPLQCRLFSTQSIRRANQPSGGNDSQASPESHSPSEQTTANNEPGEASASTKGSQYPVPKKEPPKKSISKRRELLAERKRRHVAHMGLRTHTYLINGVLGRPSGFHLPLLYSPDGKVVGIDMDKIKAGAKKERKWHVEKEIERRGLEDLDALVSRKQAKHEPPRSSGALVGKRCLITGASRGIGKAIAKRFAEEGALCLLVGRNQELLDYVAQNIKPHKVHPHEKSFSKDHRVIVGDVSKEEFWQQFKGNTIDVLVNCAGVAHYSPFVVTSSTTIEQTLQTNLMGTMLGCKIVGKRMMANREGCIINVASLLGMKGGKGSAAYAASKAGVIALTRALAAELGEKNVRVNVIVPGYVQTGMTEAMTPEAHSAALNAIPLKRFGTTDEIADAAVFLALNKYASNCVLNIDGGLSAT